MRASIAACTVEGTATSAASAWQTCHRVRRSVPRAAPTRAPSPRRKTGSRRARSAMIAANSPNRGIRTEQLVQQRRVSESSSGASAIVCAPCTRISAPSYSGREVINTIDGVRGITVRRSASIDSLTASIQCASSTMNSAGSVRASDAGVDQRGQPASSRIRVDLGQRHIGVGDAQQIIKQQQILRVGVG